MNQLPLQEIKRFDMKRKPMRQQLYLLPVAWLMSFPAVWKYRAKINKINMHGIKPPYLLLCNHNAFYDFKVTTVAVFPHRASFVVAIDGFIGREWLLRAAGCICKRKFTNDVTLVRHLQKVVKNGDIAVLYPEARYSLCGTNAVLPESLGKLAKLLKVPVVTLLMHGHHVKSPFWNLKERRNPTEAELTLLLTHQEVESLSYQEINERISNTFQYDDFAWQKANNIQIHYQNRAKGLHKVLYQCPHCGTEYRMMSDGDKLWCGDCGKAWRMSGYGELEALEGETEFSHIPDWYEWERKQVVREVENGTYSIEMDVTVDSLPNAKGYIPIGEAKLTHTMEGFSLRGEYGGVPYHLEISEKKLYSCHIEYDYLGKNGDCVDLNTLSDTFYIYPKGSDFSVTKIALATEELYRHCNETQNLVCEALG